MTNKTKKAFNNAIASARMEGFDFTDEQIEELITPTVDEIKGILSDDYRKTILYTKGVGLNENNIQHLDNSFATALMIEPKMKNDPYVKNQPLPVLHTRLAVTYSDATGANTLTVYDSITAQRSVNDIANAIKVNYKDEVDENKVKQYNYKVQILLSFF